MTSADVSVAIFLVCLVIVVTVLLVREEFPMWKLLRPEQAPPLKQIYCKWCGHPLEIPDETIHSYNEYTGLPVYFPREPRCVNSVCFGF